jgi:cell division protein FtsW
MSAIKKYFKGDPVIWIITVLLLILSIPAVYSASAMISHKSYQGDMHFLLRQIFAVLLALIVVYISYRIPYKAYLSLIKIIFPLALLLLLITLFSGVTHNDARRWIELPGVGIELQTSEIAKIALIMFIARMLAVTKDEETKDKNAKTAAWAVLLTVALIFPADLSSALMILFIAVVIMFVSGVRIKKIYVVILVAIGGFLIYILLAEAFDLPGRLSTWVHRIEVFFAPDTELTADETYQSDISKMAIVNGGFWGRGPGNGTMRFLLPQSHSDFIFAFIIEEYGMWMATIIMLLYGAFFYRGIRIARKAKSLFAIYLTLGLTIAIVLQAFINMGVALGALPVTGQTLPLISMGRTSLLVTSFSIGVILNISRMTDNSNNINSTEDVIS